MDSLPQISIVEDLHGVLRVYSDGAIFRAENRNFNTPVHEDPSVVWKDCQFDESHNLYLRLYKPVSSSSKLRIVYFYHGGGFCFGSRTFPHTHNACLRLASGLQALVVAPDYRLAPEHRLPAALDDALASLKWLQIQSLSESSAPPDTWLGHDEVDFRLVYVIADSSGGNIVHHLARATWARFPGASSCSGSGLCADRTIFWWNG